MGALFLWISHPSAVTVWHFCPHECIMCAEILVIIFRPICGFPVITRGPKCQDLLFSKKQEQHNSKVPFQSQIVPNTLCHWCPLPVTKKVPKVLEF